MPTLQCLTFDTSGWKPQDDNETSRSWANDGGDRLSLQLFSVPPDLPALYPIEPLRAHYRSHWQTAASAMIGVDVLQVRGMSLVRSVFKHRLKENRQYYTGQLILPYRDFCYTIDVATVPEMLPTERETVILEMISAQSGMCQLNWGEDPYDTTVQGAYLANPSDAENWDHQFTVQGLSVVRRSLGKIVATLMATREIRNSVPFAGNSPS